MLTFIIVTAFLCSILRTNLFSHLQSYCHGTYKLLPSSSCLCCWYCYPHAFPTFLTYLLFAYLTLNFKTETNCSWAANPREENFLSLVSSRKLRGNSSLMPQEVGKLFAPFSLESIFCLSCNGQQGFLM